MEKFIIYTVYLKVSVIKSRRLRCEGYAARMKDASTRSASKLLPGKRTRNISLGHCRSDWENNSRTDLKENDLKANV